MSPGEKSNQDLSDHITVANDDLTDFGFETIKGRLELLCLHGCFFLVKRMICRYSKGTCCFSVGASGIWAGNGTLLTGSFAPILLPLESFAPVASPLASTATS